MIHVVFTPRPVRMGGFLFRICALARLQDPVKTGRSPEIRNQGGRDGIAGPAEYSSEKI